MKLERGFESQLREAVLDDAVAELMGPNGPVMTAIDVSEHALEQHDYNTEAIIDSLVASTLERTGDSLRVTWGWTHEAADYFELGTSPHRVDGQPILSFIWEDAPAGIVDMFGDGTDPNPRVFFQSVNVSGIDELRYTRQGLDWLRRELQK